ncbi:hypothetical protein TanjilG_23780 [Lupinus angustifolius]|nr:hypothetical protein TanjilG_23780 [Lupinus angustifolius]
MEGTVFAPAIEGIETIKSEQGEILSQPFLDVCKHILPVIVTSLAYKGPQHMAVNCFYLIGSCNLIYDILILLTFKISRAMDFLVALFRNLIEHEDWSMSQACTDSYTKTLKKWHGWLASSSFTVAMKLAPDRKKFMDVIGGTGDINADIEKFCSAFSPLLEENHKFLARFGLDDLKAS